MTVDDVQATDFVRLTDHIRCVVPAMGPDLAERIAKSLTDYVAAVRAEGWQAAYDDLHETPARLTGPEVVDLVTAAVASARADERERMAALADEWQAIGEEGRPHLGCLDMYRYCASELRAVLAVTEEADRG